MTPRFLHAGLLGLGMTLLSACDAGAASVIISLQQIDRSIASGGVGSVDLTAGGTALDWLKPVGSNLTFAEKDAASLLTLAAQGTANTPGTYGDDGYSFSWSGGDSNSVSGSSFQGSNLSNVGQNIGFRATFTAPAAGDYLVRFYSAANNTANWRLTGTIDSSTDFKQAGANVGTTSGAGGVDEFFWTAQVTADSAGQVLTLDLLNSTTTSSTIAITGLNVSAVPEPSRMLLLTVALLVSCFKRRRR